MSLANVPINTMPESPPPAPARALVCPGAPKRLADFAFTPFVDEEDAARIARRHRKMKKMMSKVAPTRTPSEANQGQAVEALENSLVIPSSMIMVATTDSA